MSHALPKEEILDQVVTAAFDSLTQGVSLAQQGKISAEKVEALYALGFNYYSQKDFAKAEEIFAFAFPFDFFHLGLVNGLAAARKMQGKYDDALKVYALAALLDFANPEPSFHAAECFFSLSRFHDCAQALDAAFGLAEGEEQHHALCHKIQQMQRNLKESL